MVAKALTVRDKVAHLHRRLGFGATLAELDAGEALGVEGTITRFLRWEAQPAVFDVHPYEFFWKTRTKEEAEVGSWRTRPWWALAMMTTGRPLQEKLAVFWHGHFAASEHKVEHGAAMLDYLGTLRRNAGGNFPTLLTAMAKNPAMMRYLDLDRAVRGHPNENFAREVMELFTMGIGHYSETDVREVSRCLTGWTTVDFWWDAGPENDTRLKTLLREKRPAVAFAYMEAMRDDAPKTVLGQTKDWSGDEVLAMLALRPETAEFIARKMWRYFAGGEPDAATLTAIAGTFLKTKGNIRATLGAVVRHPQFWSEAVVREAVKSPADLVLGVARQQGLGTSLLSMREKDASPTTQIPQRVLDVTGELGYRMEQMGQSLLYPPDVSGWKGGRDWLSPAAMGERMKWSGTMLWNDKGPDVGTTNVLEQVKALAPADVPALVGAMFAVFDVPARPTDTAMVTKLVTDRGGLAVLGDNNKFADALHHTMRLLAASPVMSVC
ncbi:DUF1800 domain-containing protein [bacterium]|nr:MAG: DUF1800 domain-containing protein [bacterium]